MKVLVACEFSGIVRTAFEKAGHDAWSCDLLDTEIPGKHIKGDVLSILNEGWDLMVAHPPCTYLSYAGMSSWRNPGRLKKRLDALSFFAALWEAPINKICIENPKGCASPAIAPYDQIIQPYYFGDPYFKTTCLWLKNLPQLIHVKQDDLFLKNESTQKPTGYVTKYGYKMQYTESIHGSYKRSIFWTGIANAMARQWI